MNKPIEKITVILTALSLFSCGRSAATSVDSEMAGSYELVRIDGGSVDGGVSEEEISRLKEYGLVCELTLNEDGTAVLNNYGEEEMYSWSGNTLVMPDSEETIVFTQEESKLTIQDGETSQAMIFVKTTDGAAGQPQGD